MAVGGVLGPWSARWAERLGLRVLRVDQDTVVLRRARAGRLAASRLDERSWVLGEAGPVERLDVVEVVPGSHLLQPAHVVEVDRELRTARVLGERHVAWLLEACGVDLVVDVGANVGQFAQRLRREGYRGHVASVEPVPAYAAAAARAAEHDDRWQVHPMALGDHDGELTLRVQDVFTSAWEASDFGRRRFERLRDDEGSVTVPQHRLDTVWDRLLEPVRAAGTPHPRVYLKLDTQGFDLHAFAGLGDRAAEVVAMQSEVALVSIYEGMPRLPESLATYEAAGFAVTGFFPISKDDDGRVVELDCVLVRPGAAVSTATPANR